MGFAWLGWITLTVLLGLSIFFGIRQVSWTKDVYAGWEGNESYKSQGSDPELATPTMSEPRRVPPPPIATQVRSRISFHSLEVRLIIY